MLYDREGRPLVENRSSFTISIVREHTKDMAHTIRVLSEVAGLDPRHVTEIVNRNRREPVYRPIVIVNDASLAQVAAVLARRLESELPDVQVEEVPTRLYPTDSFAAHLFGYVGEVTEAQLTSVEYQGVEPGAIVGQAGVEKAQNKLLMGAEGAKEVIVNSLGREIGKPLAESYSAELFVAAESARWIGRNADKVLGGERLRTPRLIAFKRGRLVNEPLGVVGVISPWNFPFSVPFTQVASVVAMGNAAVLKPSELTPLSGELVAKMFREAGFRSVRVAHETPFNLVLEVRR